MEQEKSRLCVPPLHHHASQLTCETGFCRQQPTSFLMDKLVGAVQDTLESGARAIDSAINDINAGTANPGRHPQRLARLVAPQLLVIQVCHLISNQNFTFPF